MGNIQHIYIYYYIIYIAMVFWATWWGPHSNSRWFCHLFVKLRDVWWDSQFFFPIHVFFWWQTHVYHFHKCIISGLVEIDLSFCIHKMNVRNPPGIAGPNSPSLPGAIQMWGGEAIIWASYPQWGWFHLENSHKDHPSCRNLLFLYKFLLPVSLGVSPI